MPLWLFAFLAALAIVSALGVILQRNPIHSLLSLVMTLFVIGVLFIGEGAITVGFLQVIVYAGAIMVLFLFVIWLLNLQSQNLEPGRIGVKFFAGIGAAALGAILLVLLTHSSAVAPISVTADYGSIDTLADTLFSDYLIAFEVTSILLLVAVVGSIALARRIPGSGLRTTSSVARGSESNTTKLVSGVTR
jgi:NADH-quinone oxidoreductase subunit J